MVQRLRTLAVLRGPTFNPSIHTWWLTVTCNSSSGGSYNLFLPPWAPDFMCPSTQSYNLKIQKNPFNPNNCQDTCFMGALGDFHFLTFLCIHFGYLRVYRISCLRKILFKKSYYSILTYISSVCSVTSGLSYEYIRTLEISRDHSFVLQYYANLCIFPFKFIFWQLSFENFNFVQMVDRLSFPLVL